MWRGVVVCTLFIVTLSAAAFSDYDAVLTWGTDQVLNRVPLYFGNTTVIQQGVGMTIPEIEALRQTSLSWFKSQFGIPVETGIFDPTSFQTFIPNVGVILLVYFDADYDLVARAGDSFLGRDPKLRVVEFNFFPLETAINSFVYGGKFGNYSLYKRGITPTLVNGDLLGVGKYVITVKRGFQRVVDKAVLFKSKFPSRTVSSLVKLFNSSRILWYGSLKNSF